MILIADDECGIREFLAAYLRANSFEVLPVGSAEEALRAWEERRDEVELLITDMVMAGLDGKTLADRLRSEAPSLPVIFMSGHLPEDISEQMLDGAFFKKPFSATELLATVKCLLAK